LCRSPAPYRARTSSSTLASSACGVPYARAAAPGRVPPLGVDAGVRAGAADG
jgi:hypothetical protein